MTDGQLLYVYAVTRPFTAALPVEVRALDGEPPALIEHRGLCAAVSRVPAAQFDAAPLRAHLEDLDWLAGIARNHQAVIAALATVGCPVPLRLATVCRDEDGVRRLLDSGRARFESAIERLDGRVEWGVKVYADSSAPERAEPAPELTAATGREYLRRRLGQRQTRDRSWQRAGTLSRALHADLCERAEAGRLHPPQSGRLSGASGENVLNAAYLVPRDHSDEFVAAVRDRTPQEAGVRVELTGPWAPYSFVGGADGSADGGPDSAPDGAPDVGRDVGRDGGPRRGPSEQEES
ncbi:GvpL/GvpF family gas vesicle protein [Streptomyces sp. NPDC007172]|uniref:GvpL/GvpF family gas vesicle protein n=1 Tax=Streptomyces sp. NPDC007172 TaxID=3364776 RepID=UPI0036A64D35